MRQATANLLADMSALPTTLASGLVMPTKSTDTTAPTTTITQPAASSSIAAGDLVTVKGTANDVGGLVGRIEVSARRRRDVPPCRRHQPVQLYRCRHGTGPEAIQVRATDDSANMQTPTNSP